MIYKNWRWFHTARKHAPNFGGTETWYEITFVKNGVTAFATGCTLNVALENVKIKIDYIENLPKLEKLLPPSGEIPF